MTIKLSYKNVIYETYELKLEALERDRLQKIANREHKQKLRAVEQVHHVIQKEAKKILVAERQKVNRRKNAEVFLERHPNYFIDYNAKVKAAKEAFRSTILL